MRIAAVAQSVRETNYFLIRLVFGASLSRQMVRGPALIDLAIWRVHDLPDLLPICRLHDPPILV